MNQEENRYHQFTINRTYKLGIDDLEKPLPECAIGSFANSFEPTEQEILDWKRNKQKNIENKQARDDRNALYISDLKKKGEYGKEVTQTLVFQIARLNLFDSK